ncbi:hypothetical protein [Chondromyces apiculatus]|uniref:Uncharacterized protein n=1 Tax=Chondromyces apiculatus DSM 436 TaxID=1192034 RepID=A0A017TJR0_9BACT|nr:hypothetical protein [Chondromyces apiculatus]EYF08891.1 Hypothetical protein CAP_2752 [Chondromyces apiculatus DSM 436]
MEPHVRQIVSVGHLSPGLSFLFVDVMATAGLLLVAAVALWLSRRQRRAAAQAEASFSPDAPLVPGDAVIMGTVERAHGATVAVRVEIAQDGTESENSGVWSHTWTEKSRTIQVEPFYLRHASGAGIRVEPGKDLLLVDTLDGLIRVDLTRRVRSAELLPGEKVFAVGELRRVHDPEAPPQGYRGGTQGYLLGPPRGRPMLLSSEPLGQRFAQRAAFHRRWARYAVVATLAFNAVFAPFHARRWLGTTTDARVTHLRTYVTQDDDGDDRHHFAVTTKTPDGALLVDEVARADFEKLKEGDVVQIRHVPSWRWASVIGPGVTALDDSLFAVPLLGIFALAYRLRTRASRSWYERDLVDEGQGRIAESTPLPGDGKDRKVRAIGKPAKGTGHGP